MLLHLGLVVWASKLSVDDLWVQASKPRMKFGMDFVVACGIITKLASIRSKVVKSSWSSDVRISTWTILPLG